jgi:glycosyltransferase involved in cell wall biosynthesis
MLISISFCTRNRENLLLKALNSVVLAWEELYRYDNSHTLEILIIDDGELSIIKQDDISGICKNHGIGSVYHKKKDNGLYSSRIKTIELASGNVVLFLDDDVQLEKEYLLVLVNSYKNLSIGGFGGIDQNLLPASKRMFLYQKIFIHANPLPGYLSITGFNGSTTKWYAQKESFRANFLLGCNMSFRRELLYGLPSQTIFTGYSIGEDLFISRFVADKAELTIDPNAKLYHSQTQESRDSVIQVTKSTIVNYYYIFCWFQYSFKRYPLFIWSCFGFVVKAISDLLKSLVKREGLKLINEHIMELLGYLWGIEKVLFRYKDYE